MFSCLLMSCSKNDLDYKKHNAYYKQTLKYFHSNYNIFFLPGGKENTVRIDDRYTACKELDSLFKWQPLEFVILSRDSSILFYSHPSKGTKPKQVCIIHVRYLQSILHLDPFFEPPLIKEDNDWYKYERVVSIAN